jgi:glutamate N-acetyltransferase/amino-acid N-acetyltransferase
MSLAPVVPARSTSSVMASSDGLPVAGFRLAAVSAGIKVPGRLDLVLMELAPDSTVAATFTRNAFCAAPVQLARKHLGQSAPRYLLVNTGNANAGTGAAGLADALLCTEAVARCTGVLAQEVLPFSTGVIGEALPVDKILAHIESARAGLDEENWAEAAKGILTTDTRPKIASRELQLDGEKITLTGMAKGAGMLMPNMATMLAYVATDAAIDQVLLQNLWSEAVELSFNRISVDGDTSTNDAALLIATGCSSAAPLQGRDDPRCAAFADTLQELVLELAQGLVRDGEGASKFVAVKVCDGGSEQECLDVAYTIAHSPLVKTALFASDPNWGRLLAAIGRAPIEDLDVDRVSLLINGVLIAEGGCRASSYTEEQGVVAMTPQDIEIEVRLDRGTCAATVWTSDLSYDYVRINAEYRS